MTMAKRNKGKGNNRIFIVTAIATPMIAICIAFLILLLTVIIPNNKYNTAASLYKEEKYDKAISVFKELHGYKDSASLIEKCYIAKYGEELYNKVKTAKIGDTYNLGAYEQDNNSSNGKEKIEWIVLEKDDMSLLLVSKYALDCQQYNALYTDVTWEKSSLRTWLNESFLKHAFSFDEQAIIAIANVRADKNPRFNTNPGNTTKDRVFLLSITEAQKYFTTDELRTCAPTAYAKAQGTWVNDGHKTTSGNSTSCWWLRSPGGNPDIAASVGTDGSLRYTGGPVDDTDVAVRPAIWLSLD